MPASLAGEVDEISKFGGVLVVLRNCGLANNECASCPVAVWYEAKLAYVEEPQIQLDDPVE
jgi:hypothetical protein